MSNSKIFDRSSPGFRKKLSAACKAAWTIERRALVKSVIELKPQREKIIDDALFAKKLRREGFKDDEIDSLITVGRAVK